MITLEEYCEAERIVATHQICGNGKHGVDGGHGCGEVFLKMELHPTLQYGKTFYWCNECYPKIKNEW